MNKKPAVKSLGVFGSVGSIGTWVYLIYTVIQNNPDLIEDTQALITAIIGIVSSVIALYGRWRAKFQIRGIF